MERLSRHAHHLKKTHKIQAQKSEANKNDKKQKINEIISEIDKPKLDNVLDKMHYPKGKNQGRILSTHLQGKAAEFITCLIYKPNSSVAALAKENSIIKNLHVAHIIFTTFEDIAFEKLTTTIGFSKQSYPFNLLYLVWELHNGYDKTNKDKPLGMKAEIIYDLYKILLNFDMNQYQKPMRYDAQPRIFIEHNKFDQLPSGHRAHQMPETVLRWIKDLKFIAKNIHDFFIEELIEATKVLTEQQIEKLIGNLELAAEKSLKVFQKWMNCWLHLPLSICYLGGSYGHEFAKAYANVVLDLYGSNVPTLRQLAYMKFLESDIEEGITNDF
ncbi:15504_t:CDS:2, partial [Funneliformis caledonium]